MNHNVKGLNIQKDYVLVNKKDLIKPFINISHDNDIHIEHEFLRIIKNKYNKNAELYIIYNNYNKGFFEKYNEKQTWHQFYIDILRSEFYINNIRIKNPIVGMRMIQKRYNKLSKVLGLLCTQGALSLIIKKLQLPIINENYFVSELSSNNKNNKINIGKNIKNEKVMKIYFNFITNTIVIKKNLRIVNITKNGNDETIKYITLIIEFKLLNKEKPHINTMIHIKIY